MSQLVTLGYWNIRGLAQRIRLVLEYLRIPYNQAIYTPETQNDWFGKDKPQYLKKNPATNLPFLLDGDKLISQSQAIIVYLCHKANRKDLLGQSGDDQVQIATVMGVYKDLMKAFSNYVYGEKNYEDIKNLAINSFKPALDKLNGLLAGKQWFASKLSYCDFILGDFFQVMSLFDQKFGESYPNLKALQQKMWKLDGISEYLQSDRFKQRPINWYPQAKWY